MTDLISIDDAASLGIERLRKPIWADPMDHLQIGISNGKAALVVKMWSPSNRYVNGRDPVEVVCLPGDTFMPLEGFASKEFEPYDGPLPSTEEYAAKAANIDARETQGPASE